MTPRAETNQNQKPTLQALAQQTYCPALLTREDGVVIWKGECMVYGPYAIANAYITQVKDGPFVIEFLKSVYS